MHALARLPNGDLVAAGSFALATGGVADRIARWDGVAWHPLGNGMNGTVNALTVMPTGDLIAGTWVVNIARRKLGTDLSHRESPAAGRVFSEAALNLYGISGLQTLENVLRTGNEAAVAVVAGTIRRKAGIPDDPDDRGFLTEYYTALCAHLEQAVVMGRRRESKDA